MPTLQESQLQLQQQKQSLSQSKQKFLQQWGGVAPPRTLQFQLQYLKKGQYAGRVEQLAQERQAQAQQFAQAEKQLAGYERELESASQQQVSYESQTARENDMLSLVRRAIKKGSKGSLLVRNLPKKFRKMYESGYTSKQISEESFERKQTMKDLGIKSVRRGGNVIGYDVLGQGGYTRVPTSSLPQFSPQLVSKMEQKGLIKTKQTETPFQMQSTVFEPVKYQNEWWYKQTAPLEQYLMSAQAKISLYSGIYKSSPMLQTTFNPIFKVFPSAKGGIKTAIKAETEYSKEWLAGVREEPYTAGATFVLSYGLGAGLSPIVRKAGKVGKAGIKLTGMAVGGYFGYKTGKDILGSQDLVQAAGKLGRMTSTTIMPATAGGYLGTKTYQAIRKINEPVINIRKLEASSDLSRLEKAGKIQPTWERQITDIYGTSLKEKGFKYQGKEIITREGSLAEVSTRLRNAFKLKPYYKGVPTQQRGKAYEVLGMGTEFGYESPSRLQQTKAWLKDYGYTSKQAAKALRYNAPVKLEFSGKGSMRLMTGDKIKSPFIKGKGEVRMKSLMEDIDSSLGIKTRRKKSEIYYLSGLGKPIALGKGKTGYMFKSKQYRAFLKGEGAYNPLRQMGRTTKDFLQLSQVKFKKRYKIPQKYGLGFKPFKIKLYSEKSFIKQTLPRKLKGIRKTGEIIYIPKKNIPKFSIDFRDVYGIRMNKAYGTSKPVKPTDYTKMYLESAKAMQQPVLMKKPRQARISQRERSLAIASAEMFKVRPTTRLFKRTVPSIESKQYQYPYELSAMKVSPRQRYSLGVKTIQGKKVKTTVKVIQQTRQRERQKEIQQTSPIFARAFRFPFKVPQQTKLNFFSFKYTPVPPRGIITGWPRWNKGKVKSKKSKARTSRLLKYQPSFAATILGIKRRGTPKVSQKYGWNPFEVRAIPT